MPEARLLTQPAQSESVDGWPLAIDLIKTLGGKPEPITVLLGVIGVRYPPLGGCMSQFVVAAGQAGASGADHLLGNSVGAIGWLQRIDPLGVRFEESGASSPLPNNNPALGPTG